jgi:hypothetical protein
MLQLTAVSDVNICHDEELIFGNRQITVCDIASNSSISIGSVETIIHEHLLLKKVSAWWVEKTLMIDQKAQHVAVSAEHLHQFEMEGNTFLE